MNLRRSHELGGAREGLVVLAAVLLVARLHAALYAHPFEDAYITFRYAEHLAAGHGFVYNVGHRVEGFTSFGWVVLLALVKRCGLSVPRAAPVLSGGFGLGLVAVTAYAGRRLLPPSRYLWAAPALLLAATSIWAYWAMSGMETTCFAAVVALAVLASCQPGRRAALLAGLAFAVAALLRPEGVGYFGVVVLGLATLPGARKSLLPLTAAFAAVFVPYFAWRWSYFGYPLPNTYYAKVASNGSHLWEGFFQLEHALTLHAFWLVGYAAFILWRAAPTTRWIRLATFMCAGACIDLVVVGGDTFAFYRFLLPALPWGLLLLVEGARHLGRQVAAQRAAVARHARLLSAVSVGACAALYVAAAFIPQVTLTGSDGKPAFDKVRDVARIDAEYFVVGHWLRHHFPPGTTLAIDAAGIIPYESRLPTLDMLGLNDVHIAHHRTHGSGAVGHEAHDAAYVVASRPDIILPSLPVLTHRRLHNRDLLPWFARTFPFLPGDRELFRLPAFAEHYVALSVPVDHHGFLTFFLRRGYALPKR